jgi:hypothetical protein
MRECAIVRNKGRRKMKVLPDFEKRNTILKDFNKLIDERDAAWVAIDDSDYSEELDSRADKAMEKLSALIGEARKTDPELAGRLDRRRQERFRLRPRGEKARREQQAVIEQAGLQMCRMWRPARYQSADDVHATQYPLRFLL